MNRDECGKFGQYEPDNRKCNEQCKDANKCKAETDKRRTEKNKELEKDFDIR